MLIVDDDVLLPPTTIASLFARWRDDPRQLVREPQLHDKFDVHAHGKNTCD